MERWMDTRIHELDAKANYPGHLDCHLHSVDLVIIGASAGGAEAALQVVKHFPSDMPCVIMVQHMPYDFVPLYTQRVNKMCKMQVCEARCGDPLRRGVFYIAPGDVHLEVHKDNGLLGIALRGGEKVSGHRPSINLAFSSVAKTLKSRAIGVILTGMGSDGAKGLLEMRKAGAYTIGQNEETSAVYGMPRVAKEMGAVTRQLPLGDIARDVMFHLGT